jgi:uncharacterized membrane protein YgcG
VKVARLVAVMGMATMPAACNALLGADAPVELPDASGPAVTTGVDATPRDAAVETMDVASGHDGPAEAPAEASSVTPVEAAADSPATSASSGSSASSSSSSGSGSSSSGSGGSSGGGPAEGGCMAQTCHELGYDCGTVGDGCGQVISCGTCVPPQVCGGGGFSRCGDDE